MADPGTRWICENWLGWTDGGQVTAAEYGFCHFRRLLRWQERRFFALGSKRHPFAIIPSATGTTAQGLQDNAPSARAYGAQPTADLRHRAFAGAVRKRDHHHAPWPIALHLGGACLFHSALQTVFPTAGNSLALQLQQVAKLLQIRGSLGLTRQIFFCSLGGFDTHSNQIATQHSLVLAAGPGGRRLLRGDTGTGPRETR